MKSLYEAVDSLKKFTLKEEIAKKEAAVTITSIELCYSNNETDRIVLLEPIIIGFNTFGARGYFIADLENIILNEEILELLTVSNELKEINVRFNDNTQKSYYVVWSSIFDKICDKAYIMLFESKEPSFNRVM